MYDKCYIKKLAILILLVAGMISHKSNAQEAEEEGKSEHKHMLSLGLGHTHVNKGVRNGDRHWLTLPSWAIDYNYRISEKWLIGLHNEIIIEEFAVESHEGEVIERSYPISVVAMVGFAPLEHLSFWTGAGIETAEEETFALIRVGVEPSIEISEKYELVFGAIYDFKLEAYDSWGISLGIAKKF